MDSGCRVRSCFCCCFGLFSQVMVVFVGVVEGAEFMQCKRSPFKPPLP